MSDGTSGHPADTRSGDREAEVGRGAGGSGSGAVRQVAARAERQVGVRTEPEPRTPVRPAPPARDDAAVRPGPEACHGSAVCDEELLARVAWSVLAEPGDATAGAVVRALGAPSALEWAARATREPAAEGVRRLRRLVREAPPARDGRPVGGSCDPACLAPAVRAGAGGSAAAAPRPGDDRRAASGRDRALPDPADDRWLRVVGRALERWAPRFEGLDPERALAAAEAVGAVVVVPGGPGWPLGLDDLGPAAPLALWVRGRADLAEALAVSVAVVGARAATVYGRRVAAELAGGLAARRVTVVSGGAFGVDVAAHRAVLAVGGTTVALLAGGIDRPSPAGNLDVLEALECSGGALVAESPPGSTPTRSRFLQRNRLIAAATRATVVVEAAWRSGALSTAARASELLRPLGAVPGPVTSTASAGCHRLLRGGSAICVTGVDDVLELVAPAASAPRPDAPPQQHAVALSSRSEVASMPERAVAPSSRPGAAAMPERAVAPSSRPGAAPMPECAVAPSSRPGAAPMPERAVAPPPQSDAAGLRAGHRPPARRSTQDAAGPSMGGRPDGPTAARPMGTPGGGSRSRPAPPDPVAGARPDPTPGAGVASPVDRADSVEARVLDAMPPRAGADVMDLARRSGLAVREVQSSLGLLELHGLVERAPGGWRRVSASRRGPSRPG